MTERLKYTWISSANKEYAKALASVLFLSSIHSKVLDIRLVTKELWPTDEVDYWCKMVLNKNDSGLIQGLAALNQIIQEN